MSEVNSSDSEVVLINKGDAVKQEGRVLSELKKKNKKPCNVSCRLEKFGNVVEEFSPRKKQWVDEMGFGGLLSLEGARLPRSLCYWVATMVDCRSKELVTPDGIKYPLSKVQVHWVFGLPYGRKSVPNMVTGPQMEAEVNSLWDSYGTVTECGTKLINGQTIVDAVECNAVSELEFKRAFLMFALNEILCPTTAYRLSQKLLPAVTVYESAKEYDWCSLVLDHLLHYLKSFSRKFTKEGFVKGCGGCTFFLAVFYLDRLKRAPLSWGVIPRVRAWTRKEVWIAKVEDQIPNGDYGRLGCFDVAYGEPHPKAARDALPSSSAQPLYESTCHKYYTGPPSRYVKKKRQKKTSGNPYQRKIEKRRREAEGTPSEPPLNKSKKPRIRNSPRTKGLHSKRARAEAEADAVPEAGLHSPAKKRWNLRSSKRLARVSGDGQALSTGNETHFDLDATHTDDDTASLDATLDAVIQDVCAAAVGGEPVLMNSDLPGSSCYAWGQRPGTLQQDSSDSTGMSSESSFLSYSTCQGSDSEVETHGIIHQSPPPGFQYPLHNSFLPTSFSTPNTTTQVPSASQQDRCVLTKGAGDEGSHSTSVGKCRSITVVRSTLKFSRSYYKAWRPDLHRSQKFKLAKVLTKAHCEESENPVVLECDGVWVHLSSAIGLVSPAGLLDIRYVDAAAKLYNKVWEAKRGGRSKKVMLSPKFALTALREVDDSSADPSTLQVYSDSLSDLQSCSVNAVNCLDKLLRRFFPTRKFKNMNEWHVEHAPYLYPCKSILSGVAMLISVKMTEDCFTSMLFGSLELSHRAWILSEDLLSDFNEARDCVSHYLHGASS